MSTVARDIYATAAWRAARRRTLERDGYRCQLHLDGCLGRANAADHIVEMFEGGEPFAQSNLQSACQPCNSRKHMRVLTAKATQSTRAW